jgi:hypothetical protein
MDLVLTIDYRQPLCAGQDLNRTECLDPFLEFGAQETFRPDQQDQDNDQKGQGVFEGHG